MPPCRIQVAVAPRKFAGHGAVHTDRGNPVPRSRAAGVRLDDGHGIDNAHHHSPGPQDGRWDDRASFLEAIGMSIQL